MISLKESLLGKTTDKTNTIKDTIYKLQYFGNVFKLKNCKRLSSKTLQGISVKGMKELTKGMDYLDDNVERGIFDRQNKGRMLCNFIDHIDLAEWGFVNVDWKNDRTKRTEFGERLNETLKSRGGFNSKCRCWISSLSFRDSNELIIMFENGKYATVGDTFSLVFELR